MSNNIKKQITKNEAQAEADLVAGQTIGAPSMDQEMVSVNPTENMVSFVPGKNWKQGQILTGKFIRTDRIYSEKFMAGKKDEAGRKYRDLHILEDLKTGEAFGIWSVGLVGNFFDQVPAEAPVSLTYKGLGDKPLKAGQTPPHDFAFGLGKGYKLMPRNAGRANEEAAPHAH